MKDDTGENGYITATIAKCYLRQLTEYGYLEAHGGNRNRFHQLKKQL